jgi:glycosyltransferase involved in cell wall biosynthesis
MKSNRKLSNSKISKIAQKVRRNKQRNKNRKLLILVNSFSGGGAEKSMNFLANYLSKNNWNVLLVAVNDSPPPVYPLLCKHVCMGRKERSGVFELVLVTLKFFILRIRFQPDVSILNCELPEFLGMMTLFKTKKIVVEHSDDSWHRLAKLGRLTRYLLDQSKHTQWILVSDHISPKFLTPRKFRSIPNPLLSGYDFKREVGDKIERLIFIGRLSPEKSPETLLYLGSRLNLPVLFVGEGVLKQHLILQSEEDKIEAEFIGWQSDPYAVHKKGDLLIIPSRKEGDGLVILEAIKSQIPIIVSKIPSFQKLGLPAICIGHSPEDFVKKIDENRNRLREFTINEIIRTRIIAERDPSLIGNLWSETLNELA